MLCLKACSASYREKSKLWEDIDGLPVPRRGLLHGLIRKIKENSEKGTSFLGATCYLTHCVLEASEISKVDVGRVWSMRVSLPSAFVDASEGRAKDRGPARKPLPKPRNNPGNSMLNDVSPFPNPFVSTRQDR